MESEYCTKHNKSWVNYLSNYGCPDCMKEWGILLESTSQTSKKEIPAIPVKETEQYVLLHCPVCYEGWGDDKPGTKVRRWRLFDLISFT